MIGSFKGKTPQIHKTAFVSRFAYIVGDVVIGQGSSVWPGTVIRGDMGRITIGKNTNIQDNCVVHTNADGWIGDGVTIGHGVVWHGRKLADSCLVGNGAIVNDGVEMGAYSVVAAGTVVLEETVIPEKSMVIGIPGKVVRETTERHWERIRDVAKTYAEKAQAYKEEKGL